MLLFSWFATYQYVIKKRYPTWLLKAGVAMTFSGWFATLAGWYVTEIGRQPYLVTGVLSTKDAVTTTPPENIVMSLTLYLVIYSFLLIAYIRTLFVMANRAVILEQSNATLTESGSSIEPQVPLTEEGAK